MRDAEHPTQAQITSVMQRACRTRVCAVGFWFDDCLTHNIFSMINSACGSATITKSLKLSILRPSRSAAGINYSPREVVDLFISTYLCPRHLYQLTISDRLATFYTRDWYAFLRDYNHFLYCASFDNFARDCKIPLYIYLPDHRAYTRVEPAHDLQGILYLPAERIAFDDFLDIASKNSIYAYLRD